MSFSKAAYGREELQAPRNVGRVLRGGAFDYFLRHVRCAYRLGDGPLDRHPCIGFRVVVLPGR